MRGYLSPYNECFAFFYASLSLSLYFLLRVYFIALSFDAVRVREWEANTHLQNIAKNVHMAMHTYIHVYVFTSIPMYVCFLTYEAGTILTSKVVKPHTCVNVYVCMYVHMVCKYVSSYFVIVRFLLLCLNINT